MISRRTFLKAFGAVLVAGAGLGGYAFGVEPVLRMNVTRYRLTPPRWPRDLKLRMAVIADVHACDPWMTVQRVEKIVAATNRLTPDVILLLGDYLSGMRWVTEYVPASQWSAAFAGLNAPLGVHAVRGGLRGPDRGSDDRRPGTGECEYSRVPE